MFLCLLHSLLIGLKLTGTVTWSWLVVFLPTICVAAPFAIVIFLSAICAILALAVMVIDN